MIKQTLTFLFILLTAGSFAQVAKPDYADIFSFQSKTGKTQMVLRLSSDTIPGFIFNDGNGKLIFKRAMQTINDSTFVFGADTLRIKAAPRGNVDSNLYNLQQVLNAGSTVNKDNSIFLDSFKFAFNTGNNKQVFSIGKDSLQINNLEDITLATKDSGIAAIFEMHRQTNVHSPYMLQKIHNTSPDGILGNYVTDYKDQYGGQFNAYSYNNDNGFYGSSGFAYSVAGVASMTGSLSAAVRSDNGDAQLSAGGEVQLLSDINHYNINNVRYAFPAQNSPGTLTNDGNGNLTWQPTSAPDLSGLAPISMLNGYLLKNDSTIFQTKYRSDTARANIYNALNTKESTLSFITGLQRVGNSVYNSLSIGKAGGQAVIGGTNLSDYLTLRASTYNSLTNVNDTAFLFQSGNVTGFNNIAFFNNLGTLTLAGNMYVKGTGVQAQSVYNYTDGVLKLGGWGSTMLEVSNTTVKANGGLSVTAVIPAQKAFVVNSISGQTNDLVVVNSYGNSTGDLFRIKPNGATFFGDSITMKKSYPSTNINDSVVVKDANGVFRTRAASSFGSTGSTGTGNVSSLSLATSGVLYNTPVNFNNDGSGNWSGTMSLKSQAAFALFGTGNAIGTPSFLTGLDSNYIPGLHSEAYYNTKFARIGSSTGTDLYTVSGIYSNGTITYTRNDNSTYSVTGIPAGNGIAYNNIAKGYVNAYGTQQALNLDSVANGASNMYEVVQGSAPTATAGRLWQNTSFVNAPNSNNAFSWIPGLMYSKASAYAPITEQILPSGVSWSGDSWSASYNLASANNGFVNKASNYNGWTFTNSAVSGSTMTGNTAYWNSSNNGYNFLEIGINDMRTLGYAGVSDYIEVVRTWAVAKTAKYTSGINGTKATPADWIADSMNFNYTTATRTTVANSPITFNLSGSAVYVAIGYMTGSDVVYNVSIDGISKGNYTAAINTGSYAVSGNNPNSNQITLTKRFDNLGDTLHTVVLQKVSGAGQFRVAFVGSNKNYLPFGNNSRRAYITTVGRMTKGNTSSGYTFWGGSDTLVDRYNKHLKSMVYNLAKDGLNVQVYDQNQYYNPKIPGYVQSDSLHPTDAGATAIAQGLIEKTSYTILPRERQIVDYLSSLVKTDSLGNASINAVATANTGQSIVSGNGSTASFTIAHGLQNINSTSKVFLTARSAAAVGWSYIDVDEKNITVYYSTPPPAGISNIKLDWQLIP